MKIFFYSLTIALLFFGSEVFSEESEKIDTVLTEKQKLLTELIKSIYDPVEIKWINTYTIDVTCDQNLIDVMSEPDTKIAAELMAGLGYAIIHETTCVQITDTSGKELANKCVRKNEEFAEENVLITETQRLIAERIKSASAVSQAKWINTSLLEITMDIGSDLKDLDLDPKDLGLDPKSTGEKAAGMLAPWVYENTGKPVCVKVIDTNKQELAYKCVGEDKHI